MMQKLITLKSDIYHLFAKGDSEIHIGGLSDLVQCRLRRIMPMLGWPGIVGLGIFVICTTFYFSTIRPMQERLDESQQYVASLLQRKGDKSFEGLSTPIEELGEFYKYFPPEKESPRWLGKLADVAERNGLRLNHGEYSVSRDKVGQLARFKITLPVQGRYTQIRNFLGSLNTEIPNIALENVQFVRKDIQDANVQVKIMLVLYMVQES